MSHLHSARRSTLLIGGVAIASLVFASAGDALAKARKKKRKPAAISRIEAPLGLAGTRGSGSEVVVPFTLVDKSRRRTNVEAEFGFDRNDDGAITEDEYRPASENRIDPRNTRSNRKGTYSTAANIGAAQAFVWSSLLDMGTGNFPTLEIEHTAQGRVVEDPNNPGQPKFRDVQPGVRVRLRATGKRVKKAEWSVTDAFAINNNNVPWITIDGIVPNATSNPTASDETVEVVWTAYDIDSEDANGNSVLDILEGEDTDQDGEADFENVSVAFDWHRVAAGEDPATMSDEELAGLNWFPCTRDESVGHTDTGVPSSPVGRQYTFAWASDIDVGTVHDHFILRVRPFDAKREHGEYVYQRQPFLLDNWKIFTPVGDGNLLSGREGVTVTNLTSELDRSDPLRPAPFQTLLVAGGNGVGSPATTDLAMMLVSTETAETSTASPVRIALQFGARTFHSATMLDDGRVLFAGGLDASGNPLTTTEIFDPQTRQSTPGPDLLVARAKHAAVRLSSGDVAFFGGEDTNGQPLDSVEIYHFVPIAEPALAELLNTAGPDMAVAQIAPCAHLLPDQRVLVAGGIDAAGQGVQMAELFNPLHDDDATTPTTKNPRFEPTANSMLRERAGVRAIGLLDGNVLFTGGADSGVTKVADASLEVFNYMTSTFESVIPTMPDGGRANHVTALLGDGSVLLAGGSADTGTVGAIAAADIFRLGTRNGDGTWNGSFDNVNGDMRTPRHGAVSATTNNGRVFIYGGRDGFDAAVDAGEVYTPEGGFNSRPTSSIVLASSKQSWAFGAPVKYRVIDPEQDPVRVVMQWSDDGTTTWNAAFPAATTIGGDVADGTADLTSAATDDGSAIDPEAVASDHGYIWQMSADIERPIPAGDPLPGGGISDGTRSPFNLRVIPFGAVQGVESVSKPVTVLFNTKVIATPWPFEDPDGTPNPAQGGDVNVLVHLRDIDGNGPDSVGDVSSALFQYAIDGNGDGAIVSGDNEFWFDCTASGAPVGAASSTNPMTGLGTFFNAPEDSDPDFGDRPAAQGWNTFIWDALYDLGAPLEDFRDNVQIRVIPSDDDEGFKAVVRNTPGNYNLRIIKHPDGLWLRSFAPRASSASLVKANEPLDFVFNGLVDAGTVDPTTLQIFRGGSEILGVYTTAQDTPNVGETTVTFWPRPQSTDNAGDLVYGENDAQTVLFPFNEYRFRIPGFTTQSDPLLGNTLRPDNAGFPTVTSTYLLTQNVTNDGDVIPAYRFNTTSGHWNDGLTAALDGATPQVPASSSVLGENDNFTINLTKAVDVSSVKSPDLTVLVTDSAQTDAVVPGVWKITNTQAADGSTTSSLEFVPHFHLPSGATLRVDSDTGLLGDNGTSVTGFSFGYSVDAYGRTTDTIDEGFGDTGQEDTSIGGTSYRSAWGTDPCSPDQLVGLQGGSNAPQGGNDLVVTAANSPVRITSTLTDLDSLTIEKDAVLIVQANSAATIRVAGNATIAGVLSFRGADGYHGAHANTNGSAYYLYSSTRRGTRQGGTGYNGAGGGGDSVSSTAVRVAGQNGFGTSPGRGGTRPGASYYGYGGGGGAGGGHGTSGEHGGRATSFTSSSYYGAQSTPGSAYGSATMGSGPSAGSGGGGGATNRYSSVYYHQGGAGGAAAGALTLILDGTLDLKPTGVIDGRGGQGGTSQHLAGSGGGGSGGGFHCLAGMAILDGTIDLRGGRGGAVGYGYYGDYYAYYRSTSYGTTRFGGDGGLGRCRIEAGNFANVDNVRVFGQLMVRKLNSPWVRAVMSATAAA